MESNHVLLSNKPTTATEQKNGLRKHIKNFSLTTMQTVVEQLLKTQET